MAGWKNIYDRKKLPRLLQAAKEFNIGQDTLIDFLVGKGFEKDDLKPTSKLTEAMYASLQQGFHGDKAAKNISDQVELPKGLGGEGRKRRDEELAAPVATPAVEQEPAEAPEVKETIQEAPVAEVPAPQPVEETPVEETKETPEEVRPKVQGRDIEGPKIISKIDLSAIDSSTRPKRAAKKEPPAVEPQPETETPVEAPQKAAEPVAEKEVVKPEETVPPVETPVVAEQQQPEPVQLSNIQAEKIEGPKILGKIELPVDNDTRPKRDEKRKRKRIPIEKKEVKPAADTDQRRGPGHGGPRTDGRHPGQGQFGGGQHHGRGNFRDRHKPHREEKQIDEKEIQEKIRETQAKLSGGSSNKQKSMRAKARRDKRNEAAEAAEEEGIDKTLRVTEFISVSELANLMNVSFADVISKCMSLGIMVSINQRLDAEVIELVASEFGFDVAFIDMEQQMEMEEDEEEEDDESELVPRSPIVTIMGHVDHGKTSLLDYIRNANVVAGEAGGITQHIGAYRVKVAEDKEITFLDTPGHEAFTAMRARGAKVTDIAVIVVAADDAVMPQTREAISHAQAAGVPMIFAINKIDKDGANPQKIYEQLSQMNILVEEWGGKYQSQELSAKQGLNVDKLLEKILLEAELLDLKANPDREATGTIIEATLDKGRGYVATLLVENGTLRSGDILVSGQYFGRVKAMFNERNKNRMRQGRLLRQLCWA